MQCDNTPRMWKTRGRMAAQSSKIPTRIDVREGCGHSHTNTHSDKLQSNLFDIKLDRCFISYRWIPPVLFEIRSVVDPPLFSHHRQ